LPEKLKAEGADMDENELNGKLILNDQETRLIKMIRETKYGELHIFVSEGKPVRVEEIKKSIKL
jgi:hydrogenase maturation factor HypE